MPNARSAGWCVSVSKPFAAMSALFLLLAVGAGLLASAGYIGMRRQSAAADETMRQQAMAARIDSFVEETGGPERDTAAITAARQRILAARSGGSPSAYVVDDQDSEGASWNWGSNGGETNYGAEYAASGGDVPHLMPAGNGAITSPFGFRIHPISGSGEYHKGMDIDGSTGDPIRAAAGGTVVNAEWHGGYGLLVAIDHGNGFSTRYGHLSGVSVRPGQRVEAGQVIASMGSTGYSTGSHLHYEVRYNGNAIDPWQYYGR